MLRGAALLAFAQLATAFREVSDPSRPCSERAGCQACLSRDAPPSVLNHMEVCSWCAATQRCTAVAGLDQPAPTLPQYDDAAYLARVASAAPTAPVPTTVVMGGPVTAPVPTTVVMGGAVDAATPEVIPAARVATDTDAPPPYAVVVGRALSGTGPAAMM